MLRDELRSEVWNEVRKLDCRAFQSFLQPQIFVEASGASGVELGASALSKVTLVWLGIASALHSTRSFASVLTSTFRLLQELGEPSVRAKPPSGARQGRKRPSRHTPCPAGKTDVTEEAFVQARRRMPLPFWRSLIGLLADRCQQEHPKLVRWKRFRLLALDGSIVNLPHWKALGDHFGRAKSGRSTADPQARMVMLQLPLIRLPLAYELCPLAEGERTIAERLLGRVKKNDLLLIDRGFWSYGLFHRITRANAFFAIRLHPQVSLTTTQRFSRQDRLVVWTKPTGPRWRSPTWPSSQTLRVVQYRIRGFRPSAIVTNVLDPDVVSRDEWIHMSTQTELGRRIDQGLYHRRWEIETTFDELKTVQGLERRLRSRTPEGIQFEVAGHVVLHLLIRWLIVEAAVQHGIREGRRIEPLSLSFKHALEELIQIKPHLLTAETHEVSRCWLPLLLRLIAEHPVPFRPGRHYSRPGDTRIKNTGRGSKRKLPHKLTESVD